MGRSGSGNCLTRPPWPDARHRPKLGAAAELGSEIAVERVDEIPYRMYSQRPHRIEDVLCFAERWADRLHVVQGDRRLTFSQLLAEAQAKARYLCEAGVEAGQRVILLGWNGPDWLVNFWACVIARAVPVLANAWWGAVEVEEAVRLIEPAVVLADEHGRSHLPPGVRWEPWEQPAALVLNDGVLEISREAAHSDEFDPAFIIFTSGTSGSPKAVVISHRSLLANLQMILHISRRLPPDIRADSGEVILHTGPLFHIGGPQMLLRSMTLGNTIVMPSGRFDPAEALALVEAHRITRWAAVPTMVARLLDHPDVARRDLSSLRAVTLGGAPIHSDLLERIRLTLPEANAGVPTGYGLTENCGQATAASGRDTITRPGSAGRPLPCVELAFEAHEGMPDAEILVRSPTQMSGYLGLAETPIDRNGRLHTGDLGRLDADGYLWITGRCKDLIIRGGENIAPAAVERALLARPGVLDAAVVGVPHPDLGEEVFAFVVVAEDEHTPQTLAAGLRGAIASFAVPSRWHIQREPMPTNHTGKIDKAALARTAREQVEHVSVN